MVPPVHTEVIESCNFAWKQYDLKREEESSMEENYSGGVSWLLYEVGDNACVPDYRAR